MSDKPKNQTFEDRMKDQVPLALEEAKIEPGRLNSFIKMIKEFFPNILPDKYK